MPTEMYSEKDEPQPFIGISGLGVSSCSDERIESTVDLVSARSGTSTGGEKLHVAPPTIRLH
jgi:hypothetical protein